MEKIENESIKEFNYLLIQQIQKGLNYIYRGPFTAKINENIISLFESSLGDHENHKQTLRKVYQMMVEGLQNATRHQVSNVDSKLNNDGIFILKKEGDIYYIITGNLVTNEEKESIIEKIGQVNFLGNNKLESSHKKILLDSPIIEIGGAALGLLEIAQKKGNRFQFIFKKVNHELSYFYFLVEISSNRPEQKNKELDNTNPLDFLPNLHESLNHENVLILFNALLNQESIINLIAFVEKQIDESIIVKKRLFGSMIEMIQNIIQHGRTNKERDNFQTSLFYIAQKSDSYLLNSGNYIQNSKIKELSKKIELINNMDITELDEFYNERLFNFEGENELSAGLGICDIRLKSMNKLEYHFLPIDEEYSFFHFKVTISKV